MDFARSHRLLALVLVLTRAAAQIPDNVLRRYKELHSDVYGQKPSELEPNLATEATPEKRSRLDVTDRLKEELRNYPSLDLSKLMPHYHEDEVVPHHWPHARGNVRNYSQSAVAGPSGDFQRSLRWRWHHPDGRYHTTVVGGPLIDVEKNIYLATEDGIRKFSPDGEVLWHYKGTSDMVGCPSLMGHALYGNAHDGRVFAVDLEKGEEIWSKKYSEGIGADAAYVEAHNGIVVTGLDSGNIGGNVRVIGVDAASGVMLWQFKPARPVWNVMPVFPDDETVVFMDFSGGIYRLGLFNGTKLWHTRPDSRDAGSFTDGGAMVTSDSVFTCSNPGRGTGREREKGVLRKYSLANGTLLWEQELRYPCTSWPVVSAKGDTMVVPIGSLPDTPVTMQYFKQGKKFAQKVHQENVLAGSNARRLLGLPELRGALMAFDPHTGELQWDHEVPAWGGIGAAGDEEGIMERHKLKIRPICLPAHWSAPTFDGEGTVHLGRIDGSLYAYHPEKGERTYTTGSGALPPGISFAPGMMAYADCDTLYVFRADKQKH